MTMQKNKFLKRDIMPRHYQEVFKDFSKHSDYWKQEDEFILIDRTDIKSTHAILTLVHKKTIRLVDIEESDCYELKRCDKETFLCIMKHYNYTDDTLLDIMTFRNLSYPYLELMNVQPKGLRIQ